MGPVSVDEARLAAWLGASAVRVTPLGDGHSNLTYAVHVSDEAASHEYVLRRPPEGPLLPTAHDVVREYRVLTLLNRDGRARVPRVVAVCEDPDVIGAPFYLMERLHGEVVRETLPSWLGAEADRRALGLDLADALAEIHTVDWRLFVAEGLGRESGYLERQLRRWVGQREGIQQAVAAAGGEARELPDYEVVRDWLQDNVPTEVPPSVVHGDFKLDNVIVSGGDGSRPAVASVLDWEMATVGDPRADLGYLLSFWPEPGESVPLVTLPSVEPGFPTRAEMVARWERGTGRKAGDTGWFMALAVWKLAILLEASYHRWLAGMAHDPFFERLEEGVPALLARARELSGA